MKELQVSDQVLKKIQLLNFCVRIFLEGGVDGWRRCYWESATDWTATGSLGQRCFGELRFKSIAEKVVPYNLKKKNFFAPFSCFFTATIFTATCSEFATAKRDRQVWKYLDRLPLPWQLLVLYSMVGYGVNGISWYCTVFVILVLVLHGIASSSPPTVVSRITAQSCNQLSQAPQTPGADILLRNWSHHCHCLNNSNHSWAWCCDQQADSPIVRKRSLHLCNQLSPENSS